MSYTQQSKDSFEEIRPALEAAELHLNKVVVDTMKINRSHRTGYTLSDNVPWYHNSCNGWIGIKLKSNGSGYSILNLAGSITGSAGIATNALKIEKPGYFVNSTYVGTGNESLRKLSTSTGGSSGIATYVFVPYGEAIVWINTQAFRSLGSSSANIITQTQVTGPTLANDTFYISTIDPSITGIYEDNVKFVGDINDLFYGSTFVGVRLKNANNEFTGTTTENFYPYIFDIYSSKKFNLNLNKIISVSTASPYTISYFSITSPFSIVGGVPAVAYTSFPQASGVTCGILNLSGADSTMTSDIVDYILNAAQAWSWTGLKTITLGGQARTAASDAAVAALVAKGVTVITNS